LLTLAALVLLALITFSVPFISDFYFLRSSTSGGTDFGVWGWCLVDGTVCSKKTLGYSWDPEIIHWLTQALILFPISAAITLVSLISLIPTLCSHRYDRYYPTPFFALSAFFAFLSAFLAFVFMIALFSTALVRFHHDGDTASFGPTVWMSIAATVSLLLVTLSSGCGSMCRGRYGRVSPYLAYHV